MRFVVGALGMLSSVLVMPPTAAAAVERPDDGSFAVVGHGFGHGRGMSQWGAYGAARAGVGHRDILRFYYPGTVLGKNSGGDLRVLLTHDGTDVHVRAEPGLAVWWTAQNRRPTHRRLPQRLGGCAVVQWRVRPYGPDDMTVQGSACGRWHDHLGHDDILGGGRVSFVPSDDTFAVRLSRARREYRGGLRIVRDRMGLRPVNIVPYEEYLRSVVPAEVPASWPKAVLRAQSVAARSYALASARHRADATFDVYDTTRSQAYPGMRTLAYGWRPIQRHETARTDAAIRATRGDILTHRGRPARTEFGSSNGGRTSAGSVPYGRTRDDRWDRAVSPHRRWTDRIDARVVERRYPSIGRLRSISVVAREGGGQWGGRATRVLLVGSEGRWTVRGADSIASAFGLRSAWFTFR